MASVEISGVIAKHPPIVHISDIWAISATPPGYVEISSVITVSIAYISTPPSLVRFTANGWVAPGGVVVLWSGTRWV